MRGDKINRLQKAFNPTEEDIKEQTKFLKKCYENIPREVDLIKDDDNNVLLVSNPFQSFLKDCESCMYYIDSQYSFATGGTCSKHNLNCGYGFTCEDWDGNDSLKKLEGYIDKHTAENE